MITIVGIRDQGKRSHFSGFSRVEKAKEDGVEQNPGNCSRDLGKEAVSRAKQTIISKKQVPKRRYVCVSSTLSVHASSVDGFVPKSFVCM